MFPPVGAYTPFLEMAADPGKPTHTAVESFGVKPTNHASVLLSVVPVLPPAGQPIWARVPVPAIMFCWRISVALAVTPSEKTLVRRTRKRFGSDLPSSTWPAGKTIRLIAVGRLRSPPEAIVA